MEKYQTILEKYHLDDSQLTNYQMAHIQPRKIIVQDGQFNPYLWLVTSGKVKVCSMTKNGENLILSYYVSGGVLGDIELLTDNYVATATVITLSEVTCLKIPFEENLTYLKNNLAFISELAKGLTHKLQDSSSNHLSTALFSGEERLCTYILRGMYKGYFQDNLREVSETLGLSYRHVSRLLKKLSDAQIIKREEQGFHVLDEQKLWELSMKN